MSLNCIQSLEDLVKIKEIATGKYVGSFPNVPIGQYVRYRLALRMLVLYGGHQVLFYC